MTVAKLQSILAALPESHVLDVNRVGNLRVTDHTGYFIGWVDFKDGVCYEYVGTEGVEERISIC